MDAGSADDVDEPVSTPINGERRDCSPVQVFLAGGGDLEALSDVAAEVLRGAELDWRARRRGRPGGQRS